MQRYIGTVSMGVRTPIIERGDDLLSIVYESVNRAVESRNLEIRDKDVVAITESLLARAQGNYASIDQIADELNNKFEGDEIAILFPILSRNRFSILLKAFGKSGKKLHICLSYPQDEVGNHIMDEMDLFKSDVNPYTDCLSEKEFRDLAGDYRHQFTGVDYISLYRQMAPNSEFHFFNNPLDALKFTDQVLVCSVHDRKITKEKLRQNGAKKVLGLDDLMTESVDGSGYNEEYGLLGSNLSTPEEIKLFPRDGQNFVENLQAKFKEKYKKEVEVMVYGDGAFKDPVGKIWELADPVVSPAYTEGLTGTPNELKIKYIADNELKDLSAKERSEKIRERISSKDDGMRGKDETLGTTPRQITDLLGSLSDLTSGSGDKGTPVVLIQGYFDNYSDE